MAANIGHLRSPISVPQKTTQKTPKVHRISSLYISHTCKELLRWYREFFGIMEYPAITDHSTPWGPILSDPKISLTLWRSVVWYIVSVYVLSGRKSTSVRQVKTLARDYQNISTRLTTRRLSRYTQARLGMWFPWRAARLMAKRRTGAGGRPFRPSRRHP